MDNRTFNVFTYGSLMYPEVWNGVVQGTYASAVATLSHYKRVKVRDQHYPIVLPASRERQVEGRVYFNVSESDIGLLDIFEGDEYARKAVSVCCSDSPEATTEAFVYVATPLGRAHATKEAWDVKAFERTGLAQFCRRFVGFRHIKR